MKFRMGWKLPVVSFACLQIVTTSGGITYQSASLGIISSSFGEKVLADSG